MEKTFTDTAERIFYKAIFNKANYCKSALSAEQSVCLLALHHMCLTNKTHTVRHDAWL